MSESLQRWWRWWNSFNHFRVNQKFVLTWSTVQMKAKHLKKIWSYSLAIKGRTSFLRGVAVTISPSQAPSRNRHVCGFKPAAQKRSHISHHQPPSMQYEGDVQERSRKGCIVFPLLLLIQNNYKEFAWDCIDVLASQISPPHHHTGTVHVAISKDWKNTVKHPIWNKNMFQMQLHTTDNHGHPCAITCEVNYNWKATKGLISDDGLHLSSLVLTTIAMTAETVTTKVAIKLITSSSKVLCQTGRSVPHFGIFCVNQLACFVIKLKKNSWAAL